jgi:hypothetical protein
LNLIADFDQDTYKLVVTELEDEEWEMTLILSM